MTKPRADHGAMPEKDSPAARRAPRHKASLPARLALCALSTVTVLLALEGATRMFARVPPPLLVNDPSVGTRYRAGDHGMVYVPECDREVHLRFNHEGVRSPEVRQAKQPGVCRIAVIGDSMVAAIATDEPQTLVCRLEQRLNSASTGHGYEVLNFGISGSSTGQELALYRHVVRNYKPDIVVCGFCVLNDLGDNCTRLTSNRGRIYFDLDEQGELVPVSFSANRAKLTSWLNRHSRFYVWQKGAVQQAINAVRHGAQSLAARAGRETDALGSGGQGIFATEPDETLAYAWRLTEKLITTLDEEVRADGGRLVMAVLPSGDQVCDEAWVELVEAAGVLMDRDYPDQRLSEIGARIGVPVVTMTEQFRAAAPHHSLENPGEWLHYQGIGHFNDRGNDLAAEAIAATIVDLERAPKTTAARDSGALTR